MALYGEVQWDAPEPVVTGEDGSFEIAFAAMPPYQHSLNIEAEGRVVRTARWGAFEPGQVDDLGDVLMEIGYEVRGRVLDESGVPVSATVTIRNLPLPIRDDMAANNSRSGRSNEQGDFAIRSLIPNGTWAIRASSRGFLHVGPSSFTVREGGGADPLIVVVKRMPTISGTVVDENGLPAQGVPISAYPEGSGTYSSALTREDGSFVLYAVRDNQRSVRLEFEGRGGYEPLEDGRRYEWGTSGLRFQVKRALSFELSVVERGTGLPVEDYSVVAHSMFARSSLQTDPRLGGKHADGRVTVDNIWRGENKLVVLPRDSDMLVSEEIRFEAFESGIAPIAVELERMQSHSVRVVTEARNPVSGSEIELIRKGTQEFSAYSSVSDPRRANTIYSSDPNFLPPVLLSRNITNARGDALIAVPKDSRDLILRVTGDTHLPELRAGFRMPTDGTPVEIVVSRGGSLSGMVHLKEIDSGNVFVTLKRPDGRWISAADKERIALGSNGAFRVAGLSPGEYSAGLSARVPYRSERGGGGGSVVLANELERVLIRSGETTEVTLDATPYAPGRVNGRVFLDGVPLVDGRVLVRGTGETGGRYGQFVPDANGRFSSEGVLPGTYYVGIVIGDYRNSVGDQILSDEVVTVVSGQETTRDFHFVRLRVRIRLLQAGEEVPLRSVDVYVRSSAGRQRKTTDNEGWVILDPAPLGPIHIEVRGQPRTVLGPIEVPAGETEAMFQLRVESGKEDQPWASGS